MMIKPKEIGILLLSIIILAFSNSFSIPLVGMQSKFINSIILFVIILGFYEFGKKFMAYQLDSAEETKIWTFKRYGFKENKNFKHPIPLGIILSFFIAILSQGRLLWFALTESEVNPTEARAVRRREFYSYYEMTEWHLALISASGIIASFILAIISYFINQPELGRLSIYYASFNLIPFSKLDGTKIFFGSKILYWTLVTISLIAISYAVFMP